MSASSSSSDKRRAHGGGSTSHILRTTPSTSSSPSRNPSSGGGSSSSSSTIIAPPPRVALGSSSVSTDESSAAPQQQQQQQQHAPPNGSTAASAKDLSASAAVAAAAASAATHMVKEKDMRIAALERELGIMESEFTRELDKLSQNESETAAFWQAKHSALNQQFLRADTELRLLRAEVELREAERDELRAGWDSMRRDLATRDDEVRQLRAQVRGLKEWVSTSTRSDGQTSDEVFGDSMARLGNGLQNWVIVNFRRSRLDLSQASSAAREELGRLVPMYEALVHTAKVHLLQAVVSRLLVDLVFDAYFVGLSEEQARQFSQMESLLSSFAGTGEAANQWRALTLSILTKGAAQRMQADTARVTDDVVGRVNSILDEITDARSSDARNSALRALVASAVDLSRLLVAQKAEFRVSIPEILPHQRILFDPATMEDMGGEDEDSLSRREICCVAFPGIIKRGDETGGQLRYTNVISKAKVLCSQD